MVRPGCVAAFSTTELGGELEVVLEVRKSAEGDPDILSEGLEAVRRAIASEGCYPSRVVAITEKTIPKTTSGKIQRRRSREMLHQGALSVITELTAPLLMPPPPPPPPLLLLLWRRPRLHSRQRGGLKVMLLPAAVTRWEHIKRDRGGVSSRTSCGDPGGRVTTTPGLRRPGGSRRTATRACCRGRRARGWTR
ncbi:unnamed protein product [Ectocarpus sp. 12 AP-2014]